MLRTVIGCRLSLRSDNLPVMASQGLLLVRVPANLHSLSRTTPLFSGLWNSFFLRPAADRECDRLVLPESGFRIMCAMSPHTVRGVPNWVRIRKPHFQLTFQFSSVTPGLADLSRPALLRGYESRFPRQWCRGPGCGPFRQSPSFSEGICVGQQRQATL